MDQGGGSRGKGKGKAEEEGSSGLISRASRRRVLSSLAKEDLRNRQQHYLILPGGFAEAASVSLPKGPVRLTISSNGSFDLRG